MSPKTVPQPHISRLPLFKNQPIVCAVSRSNTSEIVILAALRLAESLATEIYFAYVDPNRVTLAEHPDGTVDHEPLTTDSYGDEQCEAIEKELVGKIATLLADTTTTWVFRYLAGRPDRALTHLARAVDASMIVVGGPRPGVSSKFGRLLEGSISTHLTSHQHRPVLVVPTEVVDWKTPIA